MTGLQEFINLARRCYYQYTRTRVDGRCVRPLGWYKLGSGFYGVALYHKDYPDLCLKISGPAGWGYNDWYSVRDNIKYTGGKRLDAWPVFAEHCKNNPHPNLPTILHLERVSESMTWAVMPRYTELGGEYHRRSHDEVRLVNDALNGEATCPAWLWPLRQMASGMYIEVDLHDGNIMQDDSGNFILLDPFSTTGDTGDCPCTS